jgi:hypothetical protein
MRELPLLVLCAVRGLYRVSLDGAEALRNAAFAEPVASIERLSFRTGPYRADPTRASDRFYGSDLPGADVPDEVATYYIDNVTVR